jgi:hypothetical protein
VSPRTHLPAFLSPFLCPPPLSRESHCVCVRVCVCVCVCVCRYCCRLRCPPTGGTRLNNTALVPLVPSLPEVCVCMRVCLVRRGGTREREREREGGREQLCKWDGGGRSGRSMTMLCSNISRALGFQGSNVASAPQPATRVYWRPHPRTLNPKPQTLNSEGGTRVGARARPPRISDEERQRHMWCEGGSYVYVV